ncbi:MAG: efflux RND transporter permease subunit [Planctomycetota bacterium]
MNSIFIRFTSWVVHRPYVAVVMLVLISMIAVAGYRSPRFLSQNFGDDARNEPLMSGSKQAAERPPEVNQIQLDRADAVIVAESNEFFTPVGAKAIREVVKSLEELPHVKDVLWLDRIPIINIFGLPEPLLPKESASPALFEAAKQKALDHPLVVGQFLSADSNTLILMISFDYLMIEEDEHCRALLDQVATETAAKHDVTMDFLVTGKVPFYLTVLDSQEKNRLWYQLIAYGMIAIMSIILFRGVTAVMIVAIAPGIGVFWTTGIIRFFEFQDSPFIDVILPILISLVGFTDGVHLIVQIRRNRASGMSAFESAKVGVEQVGLACGLTSLTTAIGFGSLALAHHEIIREFGWACVVGVMLTFIAVITVIPLACASWLGKRIHVGHQEGLIDKNLNRISTIIDLVLKHSRVLSVIGIALTLLLVTISLTLSPDERQMNALPDRSDAALALRKMDQALGGLEYANVNLAWTNDVGKSDGEILEVIREVDDFLATEPLIGHPISIRNLLDSLPGDGDDNERMSMLELLPPPLKRAFFTPEYRKAKVTFRVRDLGIAAYSPVFERLVEKCRGIESHHPNFSLSLSGSAIWRWENLYQIVVDLATSLGTASFIIFVVLSIAYSSLRIGLISIIPNLFPLAVAGTYLVLSGQNLEIVMVCAFTCCLGIAVDDTIHFLTRYYEELQTEPDDHLAIRKAFTGVGTALIMTTVVLVSGFLTVFASDSWSHRIFASMAAITVASALFGDLIFLPAILARFNSRAAEEKDF